MKKNKAIPLKGRDHQSILTELESFKKNDAQWHQGRTWSMVYHVDDAHKDFLKEAGNAFFSESYLNPFAFKSLQHMELDVIAMASHLLHGDENVTGTMTSGGTESIFLSVYTYREKARQERKLNKTPEIVMAVSTHPAFEKAAHILGIKVKKAPLNEQYQVDVKALEKLISPNTILVVASAPSYPHGIIDPIAAISELALKHRVPFHVDSCIGGFILPWIEKLKPGSIAPWDFRLPGVTSISADTHKFAYGSKGSSVLLYKDISYLRHQFFITTDWPGGIYASPTFMGSRSGIPIATAWASIQALGQEGFLSITQKIMAGVQRFKEGIQAIPELKLIGESFTNIFAFTSAHKKVDLFVVADVLAQKGWSVDRQHKPDSIHFTVMQHNLDVIDEYLSDLKEAVSYAKANPNAKTQGDAALYGLMARLPLRGMVANNVRKLFEDLYSSSSSNSSIPSENEPTNEPEAAPWMGMLNKILSYWPRKR